MHLRLRGGHLYLQHPASARKRASCFQHPPGLVCIPDVCLPGELVGVLEDPVWGGAGFRRFGGGGLAPALGKTAHFHENLCARLGGSSLGAPQLH